MARMIGIVDYGMGNLRSVQKGLEKVGATARICAHPADLADCQKLVLPGVGAFRDAIHELRRLDFVSPILEHIAADKPFLGICLGLQLLFDVSYEDGEWTGLGVLPGKVVRFTDQPGLKIPHMGWNQVRVQGSQPLFHDLPDAAHFYFVHSYYVQPDEPALVAGITDYGGDFTAAIRRGNLFATQFHPEKSQTLGLRLLRNFAEMPESR